MILNLFRLISAFSLGVFVVLALLASKKFIQLWRRYREESLFHLGMIAFGMLIYFLFLGILIVVEDIGVIDFIIKNYLPVIYTLICLEMSLFYLTIFINRKSLWEKYIPFVYGIGFGFSIALFGLPDTSDLFCNLLVLTYSISVIPTSFMVTRIFLRILPLLENKDGSLSSDDQNFLIVILTGTFLLFMGSLIDLSTFLFIINVGLEVWPSMVFLSGFLIPFMLIVTLFFAKKIFTKIDNADIVQLMNIIS